MCLLSTGKADLCLTLITLYHILALVGAPTHVAIAGGLGAPPQIRIKIYHSVALEASILIEQSLVHAVLDIFLTEFFRTASTHAADIDDFSFVDRSLEVLLMAELAELMLAPQAVKL